MSNYQEPPPLRALRIQYPGSDLSCMNRGDRHEEIFRDDEDRERNYDRKVVALTGRSGRTTSNPVCDQSEKLMRMN